MQKMTLDVDERGYSAPRITVLNDREVEGAGAYAADLAPGDVVELDDGSTWTVVTVYDYIQTGPAGSGRPNYVAVDLAEEI